jgi:predicted lipoprotein with Yx(FWY)xxD motif
MKLCRFLALFLLVATLPAMAAQTDAPPGVSPARSGLGAIYADAQGMTLYAMNQRQARARSGVALKYCAGPCAAIWTPLTATADTAPIGDWTVVEGAQGPQWAFKGDPVFTYAADHAPGSTAGDGYDDLWSAIRYVPPAPTLKAPSIVQPVFVDGAYFLADGAGHPLHTSTASAQCGANCTPLGAGLANRDIGDWTVLRDGDRPHWAYRGKPVYVGTADDLAHLRAAGELLRP